jgi:hypothetical protein
MPDETTVFNRIDEVIAPFTNYRKALDDLRALPPGYAMCFATHYVHSDIFNGGISQLYGNSTWALILDAIAAAENANVKPLATVLKEIVFYYHKRDRSKLKRQIDDNYFADMPDDWNKSLGQLDDEFFRLGDDCGNVIPTLCNDREQLFAET